jgi:hypothetical protein
VRFQFPQTLSLRLSKNLHLPSSPPTFRFIRCNKLEKLISEEGLVIHDSCYLTRMTDVIPPVTQVVETSDHGVKIECRFL